MATTGPAPERGGGRRLADASASVLVAAGIRKDYGDRTALRGVDLRLGRGEIVVLFGANGAGKTTLLRILAGLTRPDAGQVSIAGRRMSGRGAGAARRLVAFAGHQTLLYNDLTARENLAFYARLYGIKNADRHIGPALERAGLADRGGSPGAYSVARDAEAAGIGAGHSPRAAGSAAGRAGVGLGRGVGCRAGRAAARMGGRRQDGAADHAQRGNWTRLGPPGAAAVRGKAGR